MEQRNLISELTVNRDYLSTVERKIADVILKDPKKFITYSISELAGVAGVSQGSINNFSQKLIGSGFGRAVSAKANRINFSTTDKQCQPKRRNRMVSGICVL